MKINTKTILTVAAIYAAYSMWKKAQLSAAIDQGIADNPSLF